MSGRQTCTLDKGGSIQCESTSSIVTGISYSPRTNLLDSVKAFSVGLGFSCAVMRNNDLRCWGTNTYGQLGDGTTFARDALSAQPILAGVKSISTGDNHACALMLNGGLRCWGDNTYGQLGDGTKINRLSPPTVDTMTGVRSVGSGRNHTCAVLESGAVYCWGENFSGQLGLGVIDELGTNVPPSTDLLQGATAVAAGANHTCALMASGGVRCWGANDKGQLGDGTLEEKGTPPARDVLSGFTSIAAGRNFTCGLRRSGEAACWGANAVGQLGDNTQLDRKTPAPVALDVPISAISAGEAHVCVVTALGGVRCWGGNTDGQTGNGVSSTSIPVALATDILVDVQAVSAGTLHSCALMKSGGVRCWGNNRIGQLGDGTHDARITPDQKDVMINAKAISVAGDTTCALTQAGGVRCWGNGSGYSGMDLRGGLWRPIDIDVVSGVQAITIGISHTCVLMSAGGVRCWGSNGYGQLGQGTDEDWMISPTASDVLTNVVSLSVGYAHTCAVVNTGGVRCWGSSANGRLGSPPPNHSTPTPVQGFCSKTNTL